MDKLKKPKINYVEFYITNVCNLACPGCNRFNNYDFRGFQRWEDYRDQYRQWSEMVDVGSMNILGGEPLLNSTFMDWAVGINQLWPHKLLRITTNGFRLNKVRGLYDLVKKHRNIKIEIGIHNKQHKKEIFDIVKEFLHGDCKFEFNSDDPYRQYHRVTDSNGVEIRIEYNWWFHQGAIINEGTVQRLHVSDPEKAHSTCHMKTCHTFKDGKLYKCGVVAVLPDYDQQYPLTLEASEKTMINSYQPLTLSHTWEQKEEFIQNLGKPIAQCRFCPEAYHGDKIFSKLKKDL